MIAIIFLCITKSHLFAFFCEISRQPFCPLLRYCFLQKRWSKIAVANIANYRVRVMLTYAHVYRRQRTVRQRLRNFCIHKNKMVAKSAEKIEC